MIDADDLVSLEADAAGLTYDEREQYLRHLAPRANPLVMSSFDVQSTTGAKVRFYAIALPFTSNQMKQWLDEGNFFRVRHSIDKAIKVARFIGCDVIALGQYTSIVTRNATTLELPHVGLTTGNSYTIALALEAIERALAERGLDPRRRRWPSSERRETSDRPVPRFWRRDSDGPCCWAAASRPRCAAWRACRHDCHERRVEADPATALRQAHVVLAAANAPTAVSHGGRLCRRCDRVRSVGASGGPSGSEGGPARRAC